MHTKKVHEVSMNETSTKSVNLCSQELPEEVEMSINYTYKDSGRQLMILDCGAPISLAGISWMEQYLQEFGLTIDQMASTPCNQPFVFGPSRRYISTTQIDLPILVTRKDGKKMFYMFLPIKLMRRFYSCVERKRWRTRIFILIAETKH